MDSSVTTSKSNKKWKRRKFLRCFRPPVDTDGFVRPKITGSDGDVDEYFNKHCIAAVGTKKESAVFPADQISSTASSTFVSSEDDDDEEDEGVTRPGKIGASRRISRALKAVLRDASMQAKNIGKRRLLPQKSSNSLVSQSSRYREMEISDPRRIRRVASSLSSASYDSRASSAMTTSSNTNNNNNNGRMIGPDRIRSFGSNSFVWKQSRANDNNNDHVVEEEAHNKKRKNNKLGYATNTGMCLVVLSLLILMTWGKICAIVCTSTWLFFLPFWANDTADQAPMAKPLEMDSAEYKKRVVMEGFLARDRVGSLHGRIL